MWRNLVDKFATSASVATWWLTLEPYGGKMFYLQMEGGTILWLNSQPIQVVQNLIELFWKSENAHLTEIQKYGFQK